MPSCAHAARHAVTEPWGSIIAGASSASGDQRIDTLELSVPHPRMHERAFVLAPLAELAPALMLPQGSVTACLAACAQDGIRRLDIPPESRQG
jgi:2-amino-4-hydroxy-6-hydroxymethyldihydropteridine diphosphokinase